MAFYRRGKGLPRLSERSVDPAIGAPLCPVKFMHMRSVAYFTGVGRVYRTGVKFTPVIAKFTPLNPERLFNWGVFHWAPKL